MQPFDGMEEVRLTGEAGYLAVGWVKIDRGLDDDVLSLPVQSEISWQMQMCFVHTARKSWSVAGIGRRRIQP